MNKKGFEMSIGMIVTLILTILMFMLAINLTFKWFQGAGEIKGALDRQTEEQITAALRSGTSLVAIPITVQKVKKGKTIVFGMGVRNIGDKKQFSAAVSFSGAYTPNGNELCTYNDPQCSSYIEENWLGAFNIVESFSLGKNEQRLIPITVRASSNINEGIPTSKGDYVFNICVYDQSLQNGEPPHPCSSAQFKSTGGEGFYTGRMYQVTLQVV